MPTILKEIIQGIQYFLFALLSLQNFEQPVEITKYLITPEEEEELQTTNGGDLMEELEKIMTKMEHIMSTYKDPTLIKKTLPILSSQKDLAADSQPSAIGRLVAEISDLIHAQTVHQKTSD